MFRGCLNHIPSHPGHSHFEASSLAITHPLIRSQTALAAKGSCCPAPPGSSLSDADNMVDNMVFHSCVPRFPSHCLYWLKQSLIRMPIQNKRCCVLLFCVRQRDGWECTGRVKPSGSQAGVLNSPFSSRLCCWVLVKSRSTRWTRCRRVRWDSRWFLLPCGEAKRSFTRWKRQVKTAEKWETAGALRHQPGRTQTWRGRRILSHLLVFWAQVILKHNSTEPEHVMSEQQGNSRC